MHRYRKNKCILKQDHLQHYYKKHMSIPPYEWLRWTWQIHFWQEKFIEFRQFYTVSLKKYLIFLILANQTTLANDSPSNRKSLSHSPFTQSTHYWYVTPRLKVGVTSVLALPFYWLWLFIKDGQIQSCLHCFSSYSPGQCGHLFIYSCELSGWNTGCTTFFAISYCNHDV